MTEDTQSSLRDRAMALLLELQAEDRQVNSAERQALASLEVKNKRLSQALGLTDVSDEDDA